MAVPYTFGSATSSIPLSQLDSNFATTITLGNTAIQLGNTVTTLNNMTLANVTVSSGNVTVTSVTDTGLTAGRVNYNGTGGLLVDSANLLFDGTTLTANNITSASATNLLLKSAGTTAVTIDTSQRVGMGTASPSATRLQVVGVTGGYVQKLNNVNSTRVWAFGVDATATDDGKFVIDDVTAGSNRVCIDTSGNVGIGTTSPNQKLSVQGGNFCLQSTTTSGNTSVGYISGYSDRNGSNYEIARIDIQTGSFADAGNILFNTKVGAGALSERMRIDSSGNLLVGTTSTITVGGLGSTNTFKTSTQGASSLTLQNTNATDAKGLVINYTTDFNSAGQQVIFFYAGSTTRFNVNSNGNVANTNNSYGAISDQKLKENIVDATPKLDNLCRVKVRNFNLIGETTKQIGVVAQELEQVFPSMIEESPDRDGEGNELGTTSKSVKYSVFVPMLIKAIQELKVINDTQAETINALTARIVALETK
jgi:hypothetical protein